MRISDLSSDVCSSDLRLAIVEQLVELRAVAFEVGTGVEQLTKHLLHANDVAAYRKLHAELLLKIGSSRDVIGMGTGLHVPNHLQSIRSDVLNHPVCLALEVAPGSSLDVENRGDDRRLLRFGVGAKADRERERGGKG